RETALALKNAVTFEATPSGARRLAGNHVIVSSGPTFALFAHLAPGSSMVREGQGVRAGDVLGRVGHTGNSTLPHLHFQLMDSADPLQAGGVPCAFTTYEAERAGRWVRVERGIPRWRERIRSVG
ncbi:MAG TPA: M23 family metallopeptidase, partial [Actinomycetota bacterium]|nr:M23 family metallopeptidase [Actinomycetota bacterium]